MDTLIKIVIDEDVFGVMELKAPGTIERLKFNQIKRSPIVRYAIGAHHLKNISVKQYINSSRFKQIIENFYFWVKQYINSFRFKQIITGCNLNMHMIYPLSFIACLAFFVGRLLVVCGYFLTNKTHNTTE